MPSSASIISKEGPRGNKSRLQAYEKLRLCSRMPQSRSPQKFTYKKETCFPERIPVMPLVMSDYTCAFPLSSSVSPKGTSFSSIPTPFARRLTSFRLGFLDPLSIRLMSA